MHKVIVFSCSESCTTLGSYFGLDVYKRIGLYEVATLASQPPTGADIGRILSQTGTNKILLLIHNGGGECQCRAAADIVRDGGTIHPTLDKWVKKHIISGDQFAHLMAVTLQVFAQIPGLEVVTALQDCSTRTIAPVGLASPANNVWPRLNQPLPEIHPDDLPEWISILLANQEPEVVTNEVHRLNHIIATMSPVPLESTARGRRLLHLPDDKAVTNPYFRVFIPEGNIQWGLDQLLFAYSQMPQGAHITLVAHTVAELARLQSTHFSRPDLMDLVHQKKASLRLFLI